MKNLFYILSFILLASCSLPELQSQEKPIDTCSIAFLEVLQNVIKIHRSYVVDTIWAQYDSQYGVIPVMWINGQIDWNCIGFTRLNYDYNLTLMTRQDTCFFIIPGLYNN